MENSLYGPTSAILRYSMAVRETMDRPGMIRKGFNLSEGSNLRTLAAGAGKKAFIHDQSKYRSGNLMRVPVEILTSSLFAPEKNFSSMASSFPGQRSAGFHKKAGRASG